MSAFNTTNKPNYNLCHVSYFDVPLANSVYNKSKSISFLRPKICDILRNEMKEMELVEAFKGSIKKWKPDNHPRRLECKCYLTSRQAFQVLLFFKENIVHLCISFSIEIWEIQNYDRLLVVQILGENGRLH